MELKRARQLARVSPAGTRCSGAQVSAQHCPALTPEFSSLPCAISTPRAMRPACRSRICVPADEIRGGDQGEGRREGSRCERQGDARAKEKLLEKISPSSPACLCLCVYVRLRVCLCVCLCETTCMTLCEHTCTHVYDCVIHMTLHMCVHACVSVYVRLRVCLCVYVRP